MAFNSNSGKQNFSATAAQTDFDFNFKIYEDTDVKVYLTPVGNEPDDAADLLTLASEYTVSVDGDVGGTVTLLSGATLNDVIVVKRELPVTRTISYVTQGDLLASTINIDQNYQTYLILDGVLAIDGALRLPTTAVGVSTILPVPESLKLIRWNSTETALENVAIGDDNVFINVLNVNTIADLAGVDVLSYETVNVRGYYTANDGGGGVFNYDATQSATDNGGTIINGWVRQDSGEISVKWFGAKGDGITDDITAINSAISFIEALSDNALPPLYFPAGIYRVTESISTSEDFFRIIGDGMGRSTGSITVIDGGSAILYDGSLLPDVEAVVMFGSASDQARGCQIEDISILCQELANGIYGNRANMCRVERVYIDMPLVGITFKDASYSNFIHFCEIYEPVTGGIDLREDCHSVTVSNTRFSSVSTGTSTPLYGLRIAKDLNCSNVVVIGNNFDYYRCSKHLEIFQDCKSFAIIGNYFEAKGDGVTADVIYLTGGSGGIIHGNRITSTDSPIPTTVNYGITVAADAEDVSIIGNYFAGFDLGCIRIASGASNVSVSGNFTGGLTEVVDQNTELSHTLMNSGEITAKSISINKLIIGVPTTYTIATGVITISDNSSIKVDTEASAATDDLDTINGATHDGQLLVLGSFTSSRDVTFKDATGNMNISGDFIAVTARDRLTLIWDDTASFWYEVSRSTN